MFLRPLIVDDTGWSMNSAADSQYGQPALSRNPQTHDRFRVPIANLDNPCNWPK